MLDQLKAGFAPATNDIRSLAARLRDSTRHLSGPLRWPLTLVAWLVFAGAAIVAFPFAVVRRSTLHRAAKAVAALVVLGIYTGVAAIYGASTPGTSGPGPTARASLTTTETNAPTPPPAQYTVVSREDVSAQGRTRYAIRVVVPGPLTVAQKTSTLAFVARLELRGQAVTVFAYRTAAEAQAAGYTVGRAQLSTDGRGWTGDGTFFDGPDTRGIVGSIVLELDERTLAPISEQVFVVTR